MRTRVVSVFGLIVSAFAAVAAVAAFPVQAQLATSSAPASVGQVAPPFTAMDIHGKAVKLADFKGKHVVLEWTNPGCPFVRKHYEQSGNMPATQKSATAQGVVWLSINSTTTTHQDHVSPSDFGAWQKRQGAVPTATLMDTDGKVGRLYGARTTPHLYIVDPQGKLVYAGGIDSVASANAADIKTATNYVNQGLGEALNGKPISKAVTRAYGCSVKYADAG